MQCTLIYDVGGGGYHMNAVRNRQNEYKGKDQAKRQSGQSR